MNKQSIIDEYQILQMHGVHAQALLYLWNDGLIDLDVGEDSHGSHSIESALEALCDILDRSIIARDKQLEMEQDNDPRLEHGYFGDR